MVFMSRMCSVKWIVLRIFLVVFAAQTSICIFAGENRLNSIRTVEEYINTCPQGVLHKNTPSRETSITGICEDWSESSCCSPQIAERINTDTLYSFNHSHCADIPAECLKFFKLDLCAYECSPDHGPWIVKTNRKVGMERPFAVPLCAQDCNMWWEACSNASTCVRMWSVEFEWHTGQNTCPSDKPCVPFKEIYRNAVDFCEAVWDDAWRVDHSTQCMHLLDHTGSFRQHNRLVAKRKAEEILQRLSSVGVKPDAIPRFLWSLFVGFNFLATLSSSH